MLKRCDAVIVISEYERDYLAGKGIDAARIVTTGTGVHVEEYRPTDLARFRAGLLRAHGLSEQTRPVLFLGRKLEYKGIATLVEAFKRMPRHLDTALLLAGPSSPWFDDFYRSLPTPDRARIIDLGVVSHPDKVHLLHLDGLRQLAKVARAQRDVVYCRFFDAEGQELAPVGDSDGPQRAASAPVAASETSGPVPVDANTFPTRQWSARSLQAS